MCGQLVLTFVLFALTLMTNATFYSERKKKSEKEKGKLALIQTIVKIDHYQCYTGNGRTVLTIPSAKVISNDINV